MKVKKIIATLALSGIIFGTFTMPAFADQFNVVTLGANLNSAQKNEMLKYFNAPNGSYDLITINNTEERNELKGIVPMSEVGTRTISCAYVQPTQSGGINVKTANLTYITANMIANALVTAGINNANVIAAAPFEVSGTGALTGIMKGFEQSSGIKLNPEKKQLANKELQVTSNMANDKNVGQAKATAVVSDVKSQVIQNGDHDQSQIAKVINNVTNNYGVNLPEEQKSQLNNLMQQISKQNYNYADIKDTLNKIQDDVNQELKKNGQLNGFMNNLEADMDSFTSWIGNEIKSGSSAGIVNQTNNNALNTNAVVTGTSNLVKNTSAKVKEEYDKHEPGVVSWIEGLFKSNNNSNNTTAQNNNGDSNTTQNN